MVGRMTASPDLDGHLRDLELLVPILEAGQQVPAEVREALRRDVESVLKQVDDGKMRVLANWGAARIGSFPDLPTFRELGYKDVEFYIWAGVFAPAGLPADVRERITAAVRASVQDLEFQKAMANVNTPINYKEGKDFDAFVDTDTKRLAEVVRKMGKTE